MAKEQILKFSTIEILSFDIVRNSLFQALSNFENATHFWIFKISGVKASTRINNGPFFHIRRGPETPFSDQ